MAFSSTKVIITTLLSPSSTNPFNPFLLFYLSVHNFDDSRISKRTQLATRTPSCDTPVPEDQTIPDLLSICATLQTIPRLRTLQRKPFKNHIDLHGLLEYLWRILFVICTFTLTFRQSALSIFPFSSTAPPPNIHVVIAITGTNYTITTPTAIPAAAVRASTAVWPRCESGQEQGFLCDSRSGEESAGGLSDEGHGRRGVVTSYEICTSKERA